MIRICFVIYLFTCFSVAAKAQDAVLDTVTVGDVFDPNSNLEPLERVEKLTLEINDGMSSSRESFFDVATPLMMVMIVLFFVFLCFFLPWMFINSIVLGLRRQADRAYIESLQNQVSDYLLSEEQLPTPIFTSMTNRQRRLLLTYVSAKTRYFDGQLRDRLIQLYRANVSSSEVSQLVRSTNNVRRAAIMRRGTFLQPRKATVEYITKYLNSPNADVRLWSRIFYLTTYPDNFVELMSGYEYALRIWDKVVYCDFLTRICRNGFELDVEMLLDSDNISVVEFARKIIEIKNTREWVQ